jgi:hypothetical protein
MSDILNIQALKTKLDTIEENSIFAQEIAATGLFESWEDLNEAPTARQRKRFVGPKKPETGSPLLSAFGKTEAAINLAQYLHNVYHVSNRARLEPYTHKTGNLDLMQFKVHYDNFTILKSPNGWAAMKPLTPRERLEKDPNYDPSVDKNIVYVGVFSLHNGDDIFVKTIKSTRGGSYSKREKAEVKTATVADMIKDFGIGNKGIEVFRLMERDAPGTEYIPPEQFSGRRSKNIGEPGASVQRTKVDARAAKNASLNPDTDALLDRISGRLFKVAPNIVASMPRRLRRAGMDPSSNRKIQAVQSDINFPAFKEAWKNSVIHAITNASVVQDPGIQTLIQDFRTANPDNNESDSNILIRIAGQGNSEVLHPVIAEIRNQLESWFKA